MKMIKKYSAYPEKLNIGNFPTRILNIPTLSKEIGVNLCIKMECEADYIGSGSKIRKLHFILLYLKKLNVTDLIIDGTVHSNSCVCVSHYGQQNGFNVHLILDGDPSNSPNYNLMKRSGACIHLIGEWNLKKILAKRTEIEAILKEKGRNSFILPTGLSHPISAFGGLTMAEEIMMQERELEKKFDYVVLPVGTGSTIVGLNLAQILYEEPWKLIGVLIDKDKSFFHRVNREILQVLLAQGYSDFSGSTKPFFSIWEQALGSGYAQYSKEDFDHINRWYQKTGIYFDTCYTSKALKGIQQMVCFGIIERNSDVLLIHTGGTNEQFMFF